ncbi:hypothetical protein ACYT4K_00080 [Lactococcus lactis]|uniref:hypothetical protein n=1 Tax=Lactococcus lactis TaxID=1358 RepID=UPI0022E2F031|nr:hypothetical protein [Lactococcus lactis]MDA2886025.1 hypothetical protein [Lactococcus lactis]MDA2888558.1 hypothetical protein [Lactococcus lactis]MDA2908539.1 hypothetical protein [Lactococcus lactis]
MALFVFPLKSINGSNMYNNDDFRQYFANFISTGILANVPLAGSTAFQVTQTDSPSMNVIVGSGVAWIIGGQVMNTSPLSFKIPAPLTSQSRTDSIVVQWSNSSNNGDIIYKQNSTQVVQTNDVYELQLCKILVPANATNISQANITDMRADTSVCGFSSPYEAIKTGDLLAQFKSELEANGVLFEDWFENIKGQLSEDAAGHLQNQLDSLDSKVYTAYANSADGTDDFTTVYPNLNLLDGTKDFSGDWENLSSWVTDGTYKGLTVKKRTGKGIGLYKIWTVPADGTYTFSSYLKSSGNGGTIRRWVNINWSDGQTTTIDMDSNFDWKVDTFSISLKAGDIAFVRYEITSDGTGLDIWNAGHKWEQGSTATPWMPSASEVTTADWPQYKYVGRMTGLNVANKNDPKNYKWQSNTDVVRDQNGTILVKDLEVSGKLELPTADLTVTTKSGLILILTKRGDFAEVSFSGEVSNVTPGKMIPGTWVDNPFHPTTTKQLIGHFASRDTSFHIDLKPDGSMIWWGAAIGTAPLTARGTSTYLLN